MLFRSILDIDKTTADRQKLLDLPMRDLIYRLLQEGLKLIINTGQNITKQEKRVLDDRLLQKNGKVSKDKKDNRRYKVIPMELRRNIIIYANEGTQKYTYDMQGQRREDLNYKKNLPADKEKIKEIIKETIGEIKGNGINDTDVLSKNDNDGLNLNSDDFKDIGLTIKLRELHIEDRETQIAFKYRFTEKTIEKRKLIARIILRRLEEKGIKGLRFVISGETTVGFVHKEADKKTAVLDGLATLGLLPEQAIYFGDEFREDGNDLPVIEIRGLHIVSVSANSRPIPKGVVWGGNGPEATRAILGNLLKAIEVSKKQEIEQVRPIISILWEDLSRRIKGVFFFNLNSLAPSGESLNNDIAEEIKGMLEEGARIVIIGEGPMR